MRSLHIVQGGVENGDRRWLKRAAQKSLRAPAWVVPKSVSIGDDVVFYVAGDGFFATGKIATPAVPKANWPNRYGAAVSRIQLIDPPVSLGVIRHTIPQLTWAVYPRSITTTTTAIAAKIRQLIRNRRTQRGRDVQDSILSTASLDELYRAAIGKASPKAPTRTRNAVERKRARAVTIFALQRAAGICEHCQQKAPFVDHAGHPYLEAHHILRLSDDGPDDPRNVIGICPNCHRQAHYGHNRASLRIKMKKRAAAIERKRQSD